MNKKLLLFSIIGVIVIVGLVVGLYFIKSGNDNSNLNDNNTSTDENQDENQNNTGQNCDNSSLIIAELGRVRVDNRSTNIWAEPVYDGEYIVVSMEYGENISIAKFDENLTRITDFALVANKSDTGNESISDHKHLFQGGFHYIVFSTSGDGSGGDLYLVKMNRDLERVAITRVVEGYPPTNDMEIVGDGTYIYVTKFSPDISDASQIVLKYDADLNWVANYTEGSGPNSHSNGGVIYYANDTFYMLTPNGLAPGTNDAIYLIVFDKNWNVIADKRAILIEENSIGLVTSVVNYNGRYIVHYQRGYPDQDDIAYAVFDCNWNLIQNSTIYEGEFHAPHAVLVNDNIYLGYSNKTGGLAGYLAKFKITES